MLGWGTENGPFVMKTFGTTFEKNPYAWNNNANVLYIDQPAGVGFSWADCKLKPSDCVFNDTTTGVDNLAFMKGWYTKFPEYKANNNTLYITGESYAGIYGPTMAHAIWTDN
jgi:carboxypeptidase C (cathepsin A)